MRSDEIAQLQARIAELEMKVTSCKEDGEVREAEMRSLMKEVELKAAYIERLERFREEEVGPKEVHIRNLEAMITNLKGSVSPDLQEEPGRVSAVSRIVSLRKKKS